MEAKARTKRKFLSLSWGYIGRFIIMILLFKGTSLDAHICLRHEFNDESLRRDITAVCVNVMDIYKSRIPGPPALGIMPFVVQKAPDNVPRAVLNGLPNEYIINITCLDSRDYCRIVYQLAHEIGHHYVDPHRNNWFIESTVTALSLIALSEMMDKWSISPPYPNWKAFAYRFGEYRESRLKSMLGQIRLKPNEVRIMTWLRSEALALLQGGGSFDRPEQHACSLIIESTLKRNPESWGAIPILGKATSESGYTDFKALEKLVKPEERLLVKELTRVFGPLMSSQDLKTSSSRPVSVKKKK